MSEEGEKSDTLTFIPLGSGQEVGRSCHYLTFKGKKIMLDCGIHPGMHDVAALPFVDMIDAESLDLLLITHFHLDHCGALPWLLNKTGFRGRCFMTHATKALYRMLLGDYIKVPQVSLDILISEATYGTQMHESREQREKRFTDVVHDIVGGQRQGRCLIPAFAVGPAQELLLILDEYWEAHPELHHVPIYYASALAKKAWSTSTMWGPGSCSRKWCPDPKNGCIVAGYCVEGTLARHITSDPEQIVAIAGHRLPMNLQVSYISFSAHADYKQTSEFVHKLKPAHLILVHGEMNEMNRLKAGIIRQFDADPDAKIEVHNPRNTESVNLSFRGQKTAKVVGELAVRPPADQAILSGILLRHNYNYQLLTPADLHKYSDLSTSTLTQRQGLWFDGSLELLVYNLHQLSAFELGAQEDTRQGPMHEIRVFDGKVKLQYFVQHHVVVMEWTSTPVTDMYADAIMSAVLHAQINPIPTQHLPDDIKETIWNVLKGKQTTHWSAEWRRRAGKGRADGHLTVDLLAIIALTCLCLLQIKLLAARWRQ
ncbi:hypothetical protein M3Y99_01107700 [Aphelenchoides fujianensis]|nr:hypothetical protein M3Y99_01107700 [Aphelenchoides fujianensis]